MDYALLAATALGAIGLYLMLPRERAPLVRLGGLLGALAFAGLCLFLVRLANQAVGASSERPPVYFYLFAGIMIGGAVGVVCQPRPVYAALYFVLVTLAGAGMFVLLQAEFMAVVLIIIYAGAILVTYVFVIMLASQGSTGGNVVAPAYDRQASGGFVAVAVAFILVGAVLQVLLPAKGDVAERHTDTASTLMERSLEVDSVKGGPVSNVQLIGSSLYSNYSMSLELAGILLTIALVGAVVIARKNTPERQELGAGGIPTE